MRFTVVAIVSASHCCAALGQVLGTVTITADGGSAVTVAPGTPVSIGVRVAYVPTALQLQSLQGSVRVDGDAGAGGNFVSNLGAGPLINTGSFQGGSRVGIDMSAPAPSLVGIHPLWSQNPVSVLSYDLTLDAPGRYSVIWEFPVGVPGIGLYFPSIIIPPQGPTLTEHATITVTPAPGVSALLLGVLALSARRRRVRAQTR